MTSSARPVTAAPGLNVVTASNEHGSSLGSLKSRVLRSSAFAVGAYFLSRSIRLAANLVLTRLLVPEMFGIMAMVQVVTQAVAMFSDIGLAPSIIRSKRHDDDFLRTAWTIEVIRGFCLWLVAILLAYPAAIFFRQPMLLILMPVTAFTSVISGFNNTVRHEKKRHLELGKLAFCDLLAQLAGVVVMVSWALIHPTIWALVANGIVVALITLVLSHTVLAHRVNWFRWESAALRELVSFGWWVFLSTALTFFLMNADRLAIGRVFGDQMLGVYAIALLLSKFLDQVIRRLSNMVVLPMFSQIRHSDPAKLQSIYYKVRMWSDLLTQPMLGFLLMAGPLVVSVLYDEQYQAAGWMLQILTLQACMSAMTAPLEKLMLALGDSRILFVQNGLRVIWLAITVPIAAGYGDLFNLILAIGTNATPGFILMWHVSSRRGILRPARELLGFILTATGALVGALLCWAV